MSKVTAKTLAEIPPYEGPHAIEGIRFHPAARTLGVTAWGMNVLDLDPGCEGHPEHDHVKDGQEEVYVVLKGELTIQMGDESVDLGEHGFARVAPEVTRKLLPGPNGATVLAIGATPGQVFAGGL